MKKLLAILAACAMAMGLTACASTPKEDTPTPTPEESTGSCGRKLFRRI